MSAPGGAMFDSEDPRVYVWSFSRSTSTGVYFDLLIVSWVFLGIPNIAFLVLAIVEHLSARLSLAVAIVATLLGCWGILAGLRAARRDDAGTTVSTMVSALSMIVVATLTQLATSPWTPLRSGFRNAITAERAEWAWFFVDNILSVVLLDFLGVWGVQLSAISPERWHAKLLTVFMRLLIAIGIVDALAIVYRAHMRREVFIGTVRECADWCSKSSHLDTIGEVHRLGEVRSMDRSSMTLFEFTQSITQQRR